MDDHDAAPVAEDARRQPSRRGFLIAGAVIVAGAGAAGVALGIASTQESAGHDIVEKIVPTVPQALDDAIDAERLLIATVTAGINGATGHDMRLLVMIKADHTAHLGALEAARRDLLGAVPSPSPSPSTPAASYHPGNSTLSRKAVRSSERDAAKAGAARAAQLTGRTAALLASIAASEATHAEVLA